MKLSENPTRFGAIQLRELSFQKGYNDEITVDMKLTEADIQRFKPLLDLVPNNPDHRIVINHDIFNDLRVNRKIFNTGERRYFACDEQGNPMYEVQEYKTDYIPRKLFNLTWKLLNEAPISNDIKQKLITMIEDCSQRKGPHGGKIK